jgi:hypothetical protein
MSTKTDVRLAPRARLARGLKYSAVGPVDITRGFAGLSAQTAQATAAGLRRQCKQSRLRDELAQAAQEAVANLPQTLHEAGKSRRRRRVVIFAGLGVLMLAGGAVAFSIIRRSSRPEPSPRPPSVDVEPKP